MTISTAKPALGLLALLCLLGMSACSNDPGFIYEVQEQQINPAGVQKDQQKSGIELLSMAYADIMGQQIPSNELIALMNVYQGFGDKNIVMDLMVRNYLNRDQAQLPTDADMRADSRTFVVETYRKLLQRDPSAYELNYLDQAIQEDPALGVQDVYYAFLTSNEYKYF